MSFKEKYEVLKSLLMSVEGNEVILSSEYCDVADYEFKYGYRIYQGEIVEFDGDYLSGYFISAECGSKNMDEAIAILGE